MDGFTGLEGHVSVSDLCLPSFFVYVCLWYLWVGLLSLERTTPALGDKSVEIELKVSPKHIPVIFYDRRHEKYYIDAFLLSTCGFVEKREK